MLAVVRATPRSICTMAMLIVTLARCSCDEELTQALPVLAVDPLVLEFGVVTVGREEVQRVQIGNRGSGTLSVQARIEGDIDFLFEPIHVSIGQSTAIDADVRLNATAIGPRSGVLIITSDDFERPEVRVALSAEGGPPAFEVVPSVIDLGVVNEGELRQAAISMNSVGMSAVEVLGWSWGQQLGFVATADLPRRLLPGDSWPGSISLLVDDAVLAAATPNAQGVPSLDDVLSIDTTIGTTTVPVHAIVNRAPIAIAVEDRSRRSIVKAGVQTPLLLDGSDSSDPDGGVLQFQWRVIERPSSSSAALVPQGDPQRTRITMDVVGRYLVELTVTDDLGAASTAIVELLPRDLTVELTWRPADDAVCQQLSDAECDALPTNEAAQRCCGQSDIDLHLVAPSGTIADYGFCPASCEDLAFCSEATDDHLECRATGLDCSFANRAPEWFAPGRSDDPRLDVDDVRGDGPEVVSLNEPQPGSYRLYAHYCLDRIDEPVVATLSIFEEGVLIQTIGPQPLSENELWTAAVLLRDNNGWTIAAAPDIVEPAPAGLCAQ
jgi:hypothetical protein